MSGGMMHLRCGRLDPHDAHDWSAPEYPWNRREYHCTGYVLVEGGDPNADDDDARRDLRLDEHGRWGRA